MGKSEQNVAKKASRDFRRDWSERLKRLSAYLKTIARKEKNQ